MPLLTYEKGKAHDAQLPRAQRNNRGKKKATVAWQASHSSVVSSLLPCTYSPARGRARGRRRRTPSGGRRCCRRRRRSYGTCSQARPPLHHPCRRSNTSFFGDARGRSLVVSCLVRRALSAASLSLSHPPFNSGGSNTTPKPHQVRRCHCRGHRSGRALRKAP
jgi:hypothetical protein